MIFSELYSAYYNTVAAILSAAMENGGDLRELSDAVSKHAFSESVLTIMPSLKSEKWQLISNGKPILENRPTMPMTELQRRWLAAIFRDPRIKLFGIDLPELHGTEPLFTEEDYKIYDKYLDGDPYTDEEYIAKFKTVLAAIKSNTPLEITLENRYGEEQWVRFRPRGLEYSLKDDKIRIIADGCRYRYFNLARIRTCRTYRRQAIWNQSPPPEIKKQLTLEIYDERNSLERVMLHFAHFEKSAERADETKYILRLKYYQSDETELVIRILSFGPCVRVTAPDDFVGLIKERLITQARRGIK